MEVVYNPSKTCNEFHHDNTFVRALIGPFGSGKSAACCWEIWMRAHAQEPNDNNIRMSRWVVIRNTYRELVDTVMESWFYWFPQSIGEFQKGNMRFIYDQKLGDGTTVHLEILFRALDKPQDVKKLLSLEVTGGWVNEVREIPKAVFDMLSVRTGRYPGSRDGGPTWHGVIVDTNPPDVDHWFYRVFEIDRPDEYKIFHQPSGLSEEAENLANLPARYYEKRSAGKDKEWINVYVHGRYGFVVEGKPVYPEFSESVHLIDTDVQPPEGELIYIGIDFGLTPAAEFAYKDSRSGQWRFFDELVTEDTGAKRFGEQLGQLIRHKYRNYDLEIWGDPAGEQRAQTDERTPFNILQSLGINAWPAPTNDFTLRRESVASCLTRLTNTGEPGMVIGLGCRILRKAMAGGYSFKRINVAGHERFRDVPDKDGPYSHPAEAAQYLLVGAGEDEALVGGVMSDQKGIDYNEMDRMVI